MFLVTNKTDKIIRYVFDEAPIFKNGRIVYPIHILDLKEENIIMIETAEYPPYTIVPNAVSYDVKNGYAISNQTLYNTFMFPIIKEEKIKEIYLKNNPLKPVVVNVTPINEESQDITFTGGDGSASAINGAISLAQTLDEENVRIWAYDNTIKEYSFTDAAKITITVAKEYRDIAFKLKETLLRIELAKTIEELEAII